MTRFGPHRRVLLTLADQAVSSVSNFATGVAVARLAGPVAFGHFMLAFTIWVVILGLHRSLVTEPVTVTSPEAGRADLGHAVAAELALAAALSGAVAAGGLLAVAAGIPVGVPITALSVWIVPLLLQDFWRAMAFRDRRPGRALLNDLLFAAVQGVALVVFALVGWRSAAQLIGAWGLGATAGAILGFFPVKGLAPVRRGISSLRRLWPTSRWMLADFSTGFGAEQAYLAYVALLLSQADYGGFRAAFGLMGPVMVIVHAGYNVGLPEAARYVKREDAAGLRRFARRLALVVSAGIGAYGAVVAADGAQVLGLVYGDRFRPFGLLVTLAAVQYLVMVSVFGLSISLKASGRMRLLWRARLGAAAASLTSVTLLVHRLGPAGAGWAGVATGVFYAAAVLWVYRRESGRLTAAEPVPASVADPALWPLPSDAVV